jgi:hypothetical protein
MGNLYYVVEKQLASVGDNEGIEETTGLKNITIYDVETQDFTLFVVGKFETLNENNSEDAVQLWLEAEGNALRDALIYKLIKL